MIIHHIFHHISYEAPQVLYNKEFQIFNPFYESDQKDEMFQNQLLSKERFHVSFRIKGFLV